MQRRQSTGEELRAQTKARRSIELAENCSLYDAKEIQKRHKRYKAQAKNLAGLKGASKSAIAYEWDLLKQRMEEIEKHFNVSHETQGEL